MRRLPSVHDTGEVGRWLSSNASRSAQCGFCPSAECTDTLLWHGDSDHRSVTLPLINNWLDTMIDITQNALRWKNLLALKLIRLLSLNLLHQTESWLKSEWEGQAEGGGVRGKLAPVNSSDSQSELSNTRTIWPAGPIRHKSSVTMCSVHYLNHLTYIT